MSTNYGGYMGKVMHIDLTTGRTNEYPWSDEERRLYIGGKTMAAKILGDNLKKDTPAFSEENMLVITTGPFTGSGAPSSRSLFRRLLRLITRLYKSFKSLVANLPPSS